MKPNELPSSKNDLLEKTWTIPSSITSSLCLFFEVKGLNVNIT